MRKFLSFCTSVIVLGVLLCSTTMPLSQAFAADNGKHCHQSDDGDGQSSTSSCHSIEKTDLSVQLVRTDDNDNLAAPVDLPQYLESETQPSKYQVKPHTKFGPHLRLQQSIVLRI